MAGFRSWEQPPLTRHSLVRYVTVISCLLGACSQPPPMPHWFEAIHRVPLHTVQVDGHRIAYVEAGQGPAVILVHGFGGSMWQWEYQQEALAAEHRVITLDLLGSGLSDKPEIDYRAEDLIDFFRGFMDSLEVPRATLVGNSMGAGLVIGMALTFPDRVDRLVLIGGLPAGVQEKLAAPLVKRAVTMRPPTWLASVGNWFLGRNTTKKLLSEAVHDSELLTPLVIERSYQNRQQPGLIPPLLAATRNLPLWEEGFARRLHEIARPTLVLWGAEDRIFPPDVGREIHESIPGSSFVLIPDAGHMPQWERPEAVNPILLEFLES